METLLSVKSLFFRKTITFLLLACLLSSCGNFVPNEEIWVNADGSGVLHSISDMSDQYQSLQRSMQYETAKKTDEEISYSSLFDLVKEGDLDTIVTLSSIANETDALDQSGADIQLIIDSMENKLDSDTLLNASEKALAYAFTKTFQKIEIHAQVLHKQEFISATLIQPFEQVDNIPNFYSMYSISQKAQFFGRTDSDPYMDILMNLVYTLQTRFSIKGNTLNIIKKGVDPNQLSEEEKAEVEVYKMFLAPPGSDDYQLTVHLPNDIKNIKGENVQKVDSRTIKIVVPVEDFFNNAQLIDVAITFEQ